MMHYKVIRQQEEMRTAWVDALRKKYKEDEGFYFYSLEEISFIVGRVGPSFMHIKLPSDIPCYRPALGSPWYRKKYFEDIVKFLET